MAKRERITDFKVQRPIDYDEKAIQKCIDKHGYVLVQIKHDGIRGIITSHNGSTIAVTRENIEILSVGERLVSAPVIDYPLDTEFTIPGISFEEASGLLRRHTTLPAEYPLHIYVFDVLGDARVCEARINALKGSRLFSRVTGNTLVYWVQAVKATSLAELNTLFEQAVADGYEGIVVKDPSQHYTANKVQGWWKMKPSETVDGVVIGFVMGEEGKANEGKIVGFEVQLEDGSKCKATGISRALMAEVSANPGLFKGRYVEVQRMQATEDGNSRHPHFKCFRDIQGAEGVKS